MSQLELSLFSYRHIYFTETKPRVWNEAALSGNEKTWRLKSIRLFCFCLQSGSQTLPEVFHIYFSHFQTIKCFQKFIFTSVKGRCLKQWNPGINFNPKELFPIIPSAATDQCSGNKSVERRDGKDFVSVWPHDGWMGPAVRGSCCEWGGGGETLQSVGTARLTLQPSDGWCPTPTSLCHGSDSLKRFPLTLSGVTKNTQRILKSPLFSPERVTKCSRLCSGFILRVSRTS